MLKLNQLELTRIVAKPSALDASPWASDALVLRTAPDEALVQGVVDQTAVSDPYAIIERETGFFGGWINKDAATQLLISHCEWNWRPQQSPDFKQGSVADIATKLLFDDEKVLFVVPAVYAHEFEERMH